MEIIKMHPLLEVVGISKRFGGLAANENISFSVYQFMIMVALSGLMIYKHQENIRRLLNGQEGKLKSETRSEETK